MMKKGFSGTLEGPFTDAFFCLVSLHMDVQWNSSHKLEVPLVLCCLGNTIGAIGAYDSSLVQRYYHITVEPRYDETGYNEL